MSFKNLLAQSLLWRGLYFVSIFLVNIFLSRYLQASQTGWVYFISNIFSFIASVTGLSLEAGITFFASGKIIAQNKLLWFALFWTAIVTVLITFGFQTYFQLLKGADATLQKQYTYFGVTYIIGSLLITYAVVMFYVNGNFALPNILLFVLNIAFVLIIPKGGGNSKLSQENVLNIYFFLFLLQGAVLFIAALISTKSLLKIELPSMHEIRQLLQYAIIALAANIIFFLVYRIDYWFVNNSPVCTKQDLGNYIQVSKLGQMFLIIPQIIASAVFPQVASGVDRLTVNKAVMILARLFAQLFLLVIVFTALLGKIIFPLIFGATFSQMQIPFLLLTPGIYFVSVLTILSAYFSGKGNVMVNVKGAAIALVVVVAGDIFFVPRYGIIAAAIISTVGYTVNCFYSLRQFYKDYDLHTKEFFSWRVSDYNWLINRFKKK